MNSKQMVRNVLDHKKTERVPVDFGGTGQTGMHVSSVARIRDHYGLEKRPVKVIEPYQMLGEIGDDLKAVIGIDTEAVDIGGTMFGFRNENWKEWKTPWGQIVLVAEKFNTELDSHGNTLIYAQGDKTAPPSGKMPRSSFFFDGIIRQEPVIEEQLDPVDNTEEFSELTDTELARWEQKIGKARNSTRAIVANIGGMGFGDIALVPAVQLKHPKGIRDIEEWYISTITRQSYIHRVFEIQAEIAVINLEKIAPVIGDVADVVYICGTDFGNQSSTMCSVDTYRDLWMPYYRQVNDWIHQHTEWKTFKHCCGAIRSFIPSFIDSGFDILNPVQCSASNMDAQELKDEFGEQIVFWGGGVDTQKTLPFGDPEDVRREVLERCDIFSKNGGFVFSSIHNIQPNIPVANITALIDAVHEYNK